MAHSQIQSARSNDTTDYLRQLREQITLLLPHQGLSLIDSVRRWSDRLLVMGMTLLCWSPGSTLLDRFALARSSLIQLYPSRRRPGGSYGGFMDCLLRHSRRLLNTVSNALRQRSIQRAGQNWKTSGWVVFGVDGTKIDVPRTDRNIDAFGIANKKHAGPQMLLTCLFHLATRTLWSFRHDQAKGSERGLLQGMIGDLPNHSLIIADAGFVGWSTMRAITDAGHQFIIRAGANVKLLKQLGFFAREHPGIVYLWPAKQQKRGVAPMVLRRLLIQDARGREMCLLTSVLDEKQLSDASLRGIYAQRWSVEIAYCRLKQTMQGRKMLSTSPEHAQVELDWTLIGLWMLTLMAHPQTLRGQQSLSLAGALRAVRQVMMQRHRRRLRCLLRQARTDRYHRKQPKSKRHWPARARVHPCQTPLARMANAAEINRCQAILANMP